MKLEQKQISHCCLKVIIYTGKLICLIFVPICFNVSVWNLLTFFLFFIFMKLELKDQ